MATPRRAPSVAGQFYPGTREPCRQDAESYLHAGAVAPASLGIDPSRVQWVGGLVPHAGWVCSGAVAGGVIQVLTGEPDVETFVVFGAAHRPPHATASLYAEGVWQTPMGDMPIDAELARVSLDSSPLLGVDPDDHVHEHSIEVQLPFIQCARPSAKLLPILLAPSQEAYRVGQVVARAATSLGRKVVFLGSTDLTHYGPRYGFIPKGTGPDALSWAKEVNDRAMIDRCLALDAEGVVEEAAQHHNACGAGAIAATLAAVRHGGAQRGVLCQHTSSSEVLHERLGAMSDSVGYAGILFAVERP